VSGVGSTEPPRSGGGGFADAGAGKIFEVFRRERKGAAFEHAGSVAAPDAAFARAWAHEQYGRRGESVALWVVPRDAVIEVEDFADELGRNYHRVDGYSLKAKLAEARERARTSSRRS
jgi:phenylacetate-CoA oxygenase PaaH subunit